MKKRKVAIVYHFFAHYRGPIIQELMSSDDSDFWFVAGEQVNSSYSSLKLYDFGGSKKFVEVENLWFLNHFLWQEELLIKLVDERFDAVIFLGDWKFISTWASLFILKPKKIPTLFWSHGLRSRKSGLNNWLKSFFLSQFSHGGFVYDELAKEIMKEKGFSKPVSVIYNSLNYEYQQSILKAVMLEALPFIIRPYVVFSGRIEPRKKLDQLIEAIAYLKTKNVEIDAVIIGDGPSKPELITLSLNSNVEENIRFVGSCYDELSLCRYFSHSLGCVIPSAVGLTAIHALTYGTPVITNDDLESHGPEIASVKEGVSGYYYKANDYHSLAAAIESLVELSQEERKKLRVDCQEVIRRNFTPQAQLEVLESHLKVIFNDE